MHYYYLSGSSVNIFQSPQVWYLSITLMAMLAITVSISAGLYLIRRWRVSQWGWCNSNEDMNGKVVVITGSSCGIGRETALGLCQRGALVVMACRDQTKTRDAITYIKNTVSTGDLIFMELDLESSVSVRSFVSKFLSKFNTLDVLINNAGIFYSKESLSLPPVTSEDIEIHFAVNHLGHFLLTHLLTDVIAKTSNSRIVVVSSDLYKGGCVDLECVQSPPQPHTVTAKQLYSNSKLYNLLHARELHSRLKGHGVTVCALSPGFVYTDLFRHSLKKFKLLKTIAFMPIAFLFMRSATQGAQTSIYCASCRDVTLDGGLTYYKNCSRGELLPAAQDDDAARRLWHKSMHLLHLS